MNLSNITLSPHSDGLFWLHILHIEETGDQDTALFELQGYAHETEDAFAVLPTDAWAAMDYAGGLLVVEVFSRFAKGPLLRRELHITDEVYADLGEGVLVWSPPENTDPAEFWEALESGELEEDLPLSIGVKQ